MRAVAVTPETKQLGLIDLPEPRLCSPTDVKLRMLEAGVCGTDKEICAFEYGTAPAGSADLVIGHESLGEQRRSEERRVGEEGAEEGGRECDQEGWGRTLRSTAAA